MHVLMYMCVCPCLHALRVLVCMFVRMLIISKHNIWAAREKTHLTQLLDTDLAAPLPVKQCECFLQLTAAFFRALHQCVKDQFLLTRIDERYICNMWKKKKKCKGKTRTIFAVIISKNSCTKKKDYIREAKSKAQ